MSSQLSPKAATNLPLNMSVARPPALERSVIAHITFQLHVRAHIASTPNQKLIL